MGLILERTAADGARIIVKLATTGRDCPTGGVFDDDGRVLVNVSCEGVPSSRVWRRAAAWSRRRPLVLRLPFAFASGWATPSWLPTLLGSRLAAFGWAVPADHSKPLDRVEAGLEVVDGLRHA
jgi:hypothetical protein